MARYFRRKDVAPDGDNGSHVLSSWSQGMSFQQLPLRLRLYILAHPVGLITLIYAVLHRPSSVHWGLVCALLLFTMVFSTWKVELTVFQARMTLNFAVVCLALLLQGLPVALLCAFLGAVVGTLVRPVERSWRVRFLRAPLYRVTFN